MFLNESATSGGAPDSATYLVNSANATLSAEVVVGALTANLAIKGNDAASRTITFGQQVTAANADQVSVDVPFANFKVNASEVMAVGATQTVTSAKTFNDQTIKLRNPGNTFSYTVVHAAITADRNLTVPLLTANDTLAVLAEAQTLTNKTLGAGTVFSVIPTVNDGITFTFNPSATVSGLNVGAHSADPSTLVNGDVWYNSTDARMKYREGGVTYNFGSGGGGSPVDATYLVTSANATLTAEVVVSSLTANLSIKGDDAAGRTITIGQQVTNADTVTIDVPAANCTLNGAAVVNLSATQTLTNKTLSTGTAITVAVSWSDGVRQTFNPSGTTPGINFGSNAGDPSTPSDGDVWYNSTTAVFRCRENGTSKNMVTSAGAGNTLDQAYDQGGAGAGKQIIVDTGALDFQTTDAANNPVMDLYQKDTGTTACLRLRSDGTGLHLTTIAANENLLIGAAGTGVIELQSHLRITNQQELRLLELTANGTNYAAFRAAAAMAANVTWTLPNADGSNGQALTTDGSSALSWSSFAFSWTNDVFTGDGTTTAFTLTATPNDNDGVIVSIDGVVQQQGAGADYTVSGTTLTFSTAPPSSPSGSKVQAKYTTGGTVGVSHALLSSTHSDTTVGTVVRGDIIRGSSTPTWGRLALGAVDTALMSDGTDLVYRKVASDLILYVNYPGSAWTDFGDASPVSASTGTVKEDHDTGVSGGRNYLHMESSAGSLEVFSHVLQFRMPPWWRGWAATSMRLAALTETNSAVDNKIDLFVYNSSGTQIASKTAQVSSTGNAWFNIDLLNTDFTALPAADATIRVRVKCYSKSGNHCRFGELTMFIGSNV